MARAQGLRLVLICPYMTAWFARHPDYADVVVGSGAN
jgi:predicted GNAT family acetyltransferase